MVKLWAVGCLLVGGAAGYVVGPWLAVANGAPWWSPLAFYLAVGPLRWPVWLIAASWVESGWDAAAIGDLASHSGRSVGILQYNDGAVVKPVDRESALQSGWLAAAYTVTAAAPGGLPAFVALRIPIGGYLAWRWSWRSGQPPGFVIPAGLLDGELGEREKKGLYFAAALMVFALGFVYAIKKGWGR